MKEQQILTDSRMANYHSTSEFLVEAGFEVLVDVDVFATKEDFRRSLDEGKELDTSGQLESAQEVVSLFVDAEFSQVVRIATLLWNTLAVTTTPSSLIWFRLP
jgi:hypothetical protein